MPTPSPLRRNASTLLAALVLSASLAIPFGAADPVSDAQRWAGCGDWIAEQTLETVAAYRERVEAVAKLAKCKLKYRAIAINIASNAELSLLNTQGVLVPNQAEGVIAGRGTSADPYIIGGFELDGAVVACPAVTVRNTDAFIFIVSNWIHDTKCGSGAVLVQDAANVYVTSNLLSANAAGIYADRTHHLVVEANVIERAYGAREPTTGTELAVGDRRTSAGISITESFIPEVKYNTIQRGAGAAGPAARWGISLWSSERISIQANTVRDVEETAIEAIFSRGGWNWVFNNNVDTAAHGILAHDCSTANGWVFITGNHLRNVWSTPVGAWNCGSTIENNDIA